MLDFINTHLVEILSLVANIILTAIIIFQTHKVNKQTILLQNKQIQSELLPYRKEVFRTAYSILNFAFTLKQINLFEVMEEKSSQEIRKIFEITQSNCHLDINDTLSSLIESKFVLDIADFDEIMKIKQSYDNICSAYIAISSKGFPQEIEESELFLDYKKQLLGKIYFEIEQILGKREFIENKLLEATSPTNGDR